MPPGPGHYIKADVEVGVMHKPGTKTLVIDEGPKHTVISSCVNINSIKGELASYKSTTKRELDIVIGKNNPGVGAFNIKDHLSIGV